MEIQGKIIAALPQRGGTSARGTEWKVQEFVLETVGTQYPRKMAFEVFGEDRLQRFNIQVGQEVNVAFDIDAREYNGRWYNSVRAYDVRLSGAAQPMPQGAQMSAPVDAAASQSAPITNSFASDAAPAKENPDDLPF